MTWTGQFTVQSVSNEEAPGRWDVVLTADADAKVQPYKDNPQWANASEAQRLQVLPALASNTEGKLRSAELHLVFDEDSVPLAVGDIVYVGGHFQRRPPES